MKGILGTTAIIIAALTAAPASAGTLYKCQGPDGVTSYVSKRVAGARCSTISYSRDTRPAARPVVAAPKPAPTTVAVQAPPAASATVSAPPSPSASASRAAGPSPSPVVPEPGAPALGGPSTLRFVSTGSCMGIAAGAGARPVEAACDGGAHQRWVLLEPYEGDRARTQVRNEATGLCLTRSGGTEDHAPVDQRTCDAALENQLWNLWTDGAKGQAALRTPDGGRYLGLVEWAQADKDQAHGTAVGTTRYYYGSASMRFLFEPALLPG